MIIKWGASFSQLDFTKSHQKTIPFVSCLKNGALVQAAGLPCLRSCAGVMSSDDLSRE